MSTDEWAEANPNPMLGQAKATSERTKPRMGTDPEDLDPVAKIRHAEELIRAEHRILDDDWLFWGNLADYLNVAACIPGKTAHRPADWREFNRARDMATGYIRMSRAEAHARAASDG